MRFWLIGCGSLLVIVIVLGVVGYKYVKDATLEFKDDLEFVLGEYSALDLDFPFEKPQGGLLSADDYARFTRCRTILLDDLNEYFDEFEGEETPWKRKISLVVNMAPELGRFHVAALRKAGLSPSAYEWYVNHTFLVLRYAEHPEAPEGLKELRCDIENLSWEDNPFPDGPDESFAGGKDDSFAGGKDGLDEILPQVDAIYIRLPQENIDALLANADALRKTERVIFFDIVFLEMGIHKNGSGSNK